MRTSEVAVPWLQSTGSVLVVHRLSCPKSCGISPSHVESPQIRGWTRVPCIAGQILKPLDHQGSPFVSLYFFSSSFSCLTRPCPCTHPLGGMSLNRTCMSLCHRWCWGSARNSGPELGCEPGRCGSPFWLCLLPVRDLGQVSQVSGFG